MAANMTATCDDVAPLGPAGVKRPTARVSPLVVVLGAILLILILPPTVFLVAASFFTTAPDGSFGEFTLRYYEQLLTGRFFLPSLWNTIVYATGSAAVALVLGTAQALIVERTNTPGRKWVFLGAVISLGVPNVLYVVAWLLILGKAGPVNGFLAWLVGSPQVFLNVYSMWGMILIEGVNFVPLTFLLMSAVLRATDASFEEAAMMSGARPLTAFRTVTLRMGLPGILALLLLVFIRAFESFEVPALVGLAGDINVLTTEIYQRSRSSGSLNFGESGAYSVILLAIVAGLLLWYNQLSRNAHQYQTITGKGYRPRIIDLGRARYFTATILVVLFMLITGLPLGMLVFASLQPFYEGITADSLQRFTLENYTVLLEFGMFRNAIVNTLVLGAATATLVVPLTALCAWLAARRQPGAWVLDQIATAPLVFPAIVMSVAFLYIFVNLPIALYGTLTSIVIASAVRYLPYGMRYAYAGVLQIHTDLEDASMTAGARQGSTFIRIVLPLLSAALASAWLFVFLLAAQAVSLPLLLVGPGTEIVAVTLFDLWQNGQVTELASMGVLWVVLMTAVSALFYVVARRHQVAV
ncbi:MAG TPA: iron ABC transporter permease [Beijerinckiaceae bacterium]|nr:iron ABC transporter permease [Beijerinckiaceae bacterium]